MSSMKIAAAITIVLLCMASLWANEKKLTIIHSNDLHSHLLGFSPNIDYTPDKTGNDETIGGWARMATVIAKVKKNSTNPVLIVDTGDFTMGTLFHLLCREEAFELKLMKQMGYEALCLGNHEFDLKPNGLARILAAASREQMPAIVMSNIKFSDSSDKDDTLEAIFKKGIVKPYTIIDKGGLRIGLFGLMGKDAAEVAPFASPVTFGDPLVSAKEMVALLRGKEKVDLVVALSHCGLNPNSSKSEDQNIARQTKGIDIIISGHTHTRLTKPIIENGAIIVQSWEYGKTLGILDISVNKGKVTLDKYEETLIDDSIPGDPLITGKINGYINDLNRRILNDYDLSFSTIIAESGFDINIVQDECGLGNIIADSLRWYVNKVDSDPGDPSSRVTVAVESYGLIRDSVLKGKTGKIAVCDLFNAFPLGIGWDDTMCYPVVSFYLNASEIKKTLEVLTSIYPLKGSDYFLQISGLKFTYNPNRVIFDRVTEILMENEKGHYQPLDYSSSNKTLYRVAANIYNATFLKIIGSYTMNILTIVPKDKNGAPIDDLAKAIVDGDREKAGVQELKEWLGMMLFVKGFPDIDGNGIPDVPEAYREKQGRIVMAASWNPVSLLSRGTWITWTVFAVLMLVISLTATVIVKVVKIARRRSHHA